MSPNWLFHNFLMYLQWNTICSKSTLSIPTWLPLTHWKLKWRSHRNLEDIRKLSGWILSFYRCRNWGPREIKWIAQGEYHCYQGRILLMGIQNKLIISVKKTDLKYSYIETSNIKKYWAIFFFGLIIGLGFSWSLYLPIVCVCMYFLYFYILKMVKLFSIVDDMIFM